MTYIFYDTETTGTDTTFDQVLQFAALKADDDLNVLESFDIRGRLLPHIVPSPGALLVTGVAIRDILQCPLTHYEMALQVHRKMAEWSRGGAIFVGWNSLRFDESLLRQTYYQGLLPVYQTNTNGNGRADVMRIAQIVAAAAPGTLKIPSNGGKPSYRLGLVAEANGIKLHNAHEALADTTATLAVAKLIRQRAPVIWKTLIANGKKAAVLQLIDGNPALLMVENYFGNSHVYAAAPIAANEGNDNEWGVFDLQFDPAPYLNQSVDSLRVIVEAKAIRRISINSQPGLLPIEFSPEEMKGGRLPLETFRTRAQAIRESGKFRENVSKLLGELHREKYGDAELSPNIEERIHEGFPKAQDSKRMDLFHRSDWNARRGILDEFDDARFQEIGLRIIASGQPIVLPKDSVRKWQKWRRERLFEKGDVPWLTVPKALEQTASLEVKATAEQKHSLGKIKKYLNSLS